MLPLAGVTSNPTIAKKEGEIDFFKRIHEVREIIGEAPSIHVQVVAKDYDGILKDAAKIRQECGGNVFIKVPVTPEGLAAIKTLKSEGYKITATAIYTVFQGLLAIEAGADYLAPYYNRMENLNIDSAQVIAQLAEAIEKIIHQAKFWQRPLRMLVKSIGHSKKEHKRLLLEQMCLKQPLECHQLGKQWMILQTIGQPFIIRI